MASLELSEKKSRVGYLTPPVIKTGRNRNRDGRSSRTPPPDYDAFLSENELPSARTQFASSHMRNNNNNRVSSYNFSRVSYCEFIRIILFLFCEHTIYIYL